MLTSSFSRLLCCFLLVLYGFAAQAGIGAWTAEGPESADIKSLAFDGKVLYAGTAGAGVFVSDDGGANWVAINSGLPNLYVLHVLIDSSGTVYVGTAGAGIFKRLQGVWTAINNGLPNSLSVNAMAINAKGQLFANTDQGVFKSTDGSNWEDSGLPVNVYTALVIDPKGTVYTGTKYGQLYKSDVNGANWTGRDGGVTPGTFLYCFYLDKNGAIYAGGGNAAIWKSTDNGVTWNRADTGLTSQSLTLSLVGDGNTLYAATSTGIYKTTDGGANWISINNGLPTGSSYQALVVTSAAIYVGTQGFGLYKTTDVGNAWTSSNSGMVGSTVTSLAVSDGGDIYAGTSGGLYKRPGGSSNWSYIGFPNGLSPAGGVDQAVARVIRIDKSGSVYVGTNVGVSKYINGNWLNSTLTYTYLEFLLTASVRSLEFDNSGAVYAGTSHALFKSSDGVSNWVNFSGFPQSSTPGFPLCCNPENDVTSLLISPSGAFYVSTAGRNFTRKDEFSDWTVVSAGNLSLFLAAGKDTVYALGRDGYVYFSKDQGANWSVMSNGLPSRPVKSLVIGGDTLYAATDVGIYTSNGNLTWNSLNSGLTNTRILALALDSRGTLYAGTDGAGLFTYTPKSFQISATNLNVSVTVGATDTGKIGNLYAAAFLPDGRIFQLSATGWSAFDGAFRPYANVSLGSHQISITPDPQLGMTASGTRYYVGFGVDQADLLNNQKYALVYSVP